ncbi:MAG: energy transducer TonB [Pseudoxanthomonas sp.]|nr:energy transducer TonB [Pseudoxanthomonas sp.]
MLCKNIPARSRLGACLLLTVALAACSRPEPSAPAPATAPAPTSESAPAAAAPAPTSPPATVVAANVQAMGVDQLREGAAKALRENRMYAPAGDNAMEYYLALRDKLPDDAGVSSALTDLMPYTVIAAEQAVAREQFDEAQRLAALIDKADASAPALPRIRQSIVASEQAVAKRSEETAARTKAEAEARVLAQQQAAQQAALTAQAEAEAAARLLAEQEEATRQAAIRREAEQREAAARQAAEASAAAAAAAAARPVARSLRSISTPAPRFPPDALRSGTSGEVLVEFTVGTDGSVTDARVLRAEPARTFDREAVNAVRRWRFEPVDAPVTTRRTLVFNPGG